MKEIWFVTGSQHLYGDDALRQVDSDAKEISAHLDSHNSIITKIIHKPVLTTAEQILSLSKEANSDNKCIGLIFWMHTFSPAKMWIAGLNILHKPYVHFHTQFNRDIPWETIDMDFMNLNQSAHGGREFGFINSRMRLDRKVITGHWKDPEAVASLARWVRVALAYADAQNLKVARFGDNMRDVAVTEGDKVAAEMKLGFSVQGYGVGDLVKYINEVSEPEIRVLLEEYSDSYNMGTGETYNETIREAARIEAGLEKFLVEGGFGAFTTTFEDLHGLKQLPGLAVQRLMGKGYGFGAEGDWKTAALVRTVKVMGQGLEGGSSFMEDYTYHLEPDNMCVLGSHMLEVCPSVASGKPSLETHPLGIGGKEDPARLIFQSKTGKAVNATILDMGNRFRLLTNTVDVIECPAMPNLPVAGVLWKPQPDLPTAATAWILAGGAHHTAFSLAIGHEYFLDYAKMTGIEYLAIDKDTNLQEFENHIRWNEVYYRLKDGLKA